MSAFGQKRTFKSVKNRGLSLIISAAALTFVVVREDGIKSKLPEYVGNNIP